MNEIEKLIDELMETVEIIARTSDFSNKANDVLKSRKSALLAEYEELEQASGTLLEVKEQLEKADYTIEQEGEETVVECEFCGFPIDEGHADDCPNNFEFKLAAEHEHSERLTKILDGLGDELEEDGGWRCCDGGEK